MSDSLKIWGTDYTGVVGFKAKDSSNNQYAYLRPQGSKSITENGSNIDVAEYATVNVSVSGGGGNDFIVTISYNDSSQKWEPDRTFAEIQAAYANGKNIIVTSAQAMCAGEYDSSVPVFIYSLLTDGNPSVLYVYSFDAQDITKMWEANLIDTSNATVTPGDVLDGVLAFGANGAVWGTIPRKTSSNLTVSGATVTAPAGYYANDATKTVSSGTEGTPTATKGTVSNHSVSVTPSVTNTVGYISGGTHTGTAVTVSASELVSGTKSISANGTNIDVTDYAAVDVAVPSSSPNLQAKTNITPTESSQTITADNGYDGLSSVQINAISSTYVGSGITRRTINDLDIYSESNQYWAEIPAGYYANTESQNISGTAGTPTATRGTVSAHSVTITPSVTNVAGYIPGGTKTGTSVTVYASELVSGSETKTSNGTYVVTNLQYLIVDVPYVTYYTGSSAPSSSLGSDGDIYLQTGS